MRPFCLFSAMLLTINCFSQRVGGIYFEQGTNWKQVKEKARKENKYIFVDIYTTWCVPCKKMAVEIFPLKSVGDYFNAKFINIKVQMDSTEKDENEVKKWYQDAKEMARTYPISAYPTYLFFNPEGILVHKVVGATLDPKAFILKASEALDVSRQYVRLKKEYEDGRRDTGFLSTIIEVSANANDWKKRKRYVQSFLKTQQNLLTSKNIKLISQSVMASSDVGYDILVNHPSRVDKIIGPKRRNGIINDVVFDEYILPKLRIGGSKYYYETGLYTYNGEIIRNVNWVSLNDSLNVNYAERAHRLLAEAKVTYYKWLHDWSNVNRALTHYVLIDKNLDVMFLGNELMAFASDCKRKEQIKKALNWARVIANDRQHPLSIPNYSILLYKLGKKKQALARLISYQQTLTKPREDIAELIMKMEKVENIN